MTRGLSRALDNNPELIHTEHAIDRMLEQRKAVAEPNPQDLADKVLLLKINQLEDKVDTLSGLIRQLMADRYPRYVGTKEACRILGIGSTTMDKRLQAGYIRLQSRKISAGAFRWPSCTDSRASYEKGFTIQA